MRILVTGASGFIGSHIVEEGVRRGDEVWAGVRSTSSRRWLGVAGVRFVELDFGSVGALRGALLRCRELFGGWDVIVHAAGVTKCVRREDFYRVNYEGTRRFVDLLVELGMVPRRFVFLSSLSVFGAVREGRVDEGGRVYGVIRGDDEPRPNTAYGRSKLLAERYIKSVAGFPYVILRPTGVYGPRERDYFLMMQGLSRHVDFAVGFRPQEITFVYVKDLVQAVFLAVERDVVGGEFFISDGCVYQSRDFSDLVCAELGVRFVLRVRCPLWLLRVVCGVSGRVSAWRGEVSTLNGDKYYILSQRNWQCDIEPARECLGYSPRYGLRDGVRETVAWCKGEGWL